MPDIYPLFRSCLRNDWPDFVYLWTWDMKGMYLDGELSAWYIEKKSGDEYTDNFFLWFRYT